MADASLERELQCAICTDILYQPLTLLDCLHTFCGSCLKEWFAWQAASAANNRRAAAPYTCPSCRDSVRGTKVDWRANTLLEGFLKANPDRDKSEKDKEEMRKIYTPGDDVLKDIERNAEEDDSEDDRLMAQVREISLAGTSSGGGRRTRERSRDRRRRHEGASGQQRSDQGHLTQARWEQHDRGEPRIEHQSSLRSLLSASEAGSRDVQAEILRAIYAEGVLDGVDLDNLTTEQEEELTDRIAAAYRRRQEQQQSQAQTRDRSRNHGQRHRDSRSPNTRPAESSDARLHTQTDAESAQQQPRARPPISRPHLFEQGLQEPPRDQQRSVSSTSQRTNRSAPRHEGSSPANRSATDLSLQPHSDDRQRVRHGRGSSTGRSITDPETGGMREHIQRIRAESNQDRPVSSSRTAQDSRASNERPSRASTTAYEESSSPRSIPLPPEAVSHQPIRPAPSMAAFAPEPVASSLASQAAPSITCDRCGQREIQHELHYNCSRCSDGRFNICLKCYRNEQGCNYWFGFGFRANDRWYRNAPQGGWPHGQELPHVLTPRRYVRPSDTSSRDASGMTRLQEGAFCESCFAFTSDCYWYCTDYCLEGAWGFCDNCVKQGRHCSHSLLLTSHVSYLQQPHYDPTKYSIVDLPHLPPGSFATLPPTTHCDICHRPIPPNSTRFHCYQCSDGDYDMCTECYRSLVAQGKISQANGPDGWRRCLRGHRMAIVGYQDRLEGGHLRRTVSEMVGGWDFKDDESTRAGHTPPSGRLPPPGGHGMRCLALYSYFPADGEADELAFPKNAELREVKDIQNDDWYLGVYAAAIRLIPRNYVGQI